MNGFERNDYGQSLKATRVNRPAAASQKNAFQEIVEE
jgi:hypothetical protein